MAWGAAAALAVVFSYLMTLALGLGLLAVPVFVATNLLEGNGSGLTLQILLGVFGLVAGASTLWSLVPRRIQFTGPGPSINLAQQPRLAAEIQGIAKTLGEPMPSEVYLIADANAFVSQFGRRRILGLGLPLLQTLTVAEFRAIMAHEFGHFYSGDTRLGPVVYRGRMTMVRVYDNLTKNSEMLQFLRRWAVIAAAHSLLTGFLRGYWKLFLRLTQMISRKQEFRADEIACYVAGSDAVTGALESINRTGAVTPAYWQNVVLPLAGRGFLTPIGESFGMFVATPVVAKAAEEALSKQLENTRLNPFDTHPPLGARIAKTKAIAVGGSETLNLPAISLLDGVNALERKLLCRLIPQLNEGQLKPMAWETSAEEVFIPSWRSELAPFQPILTEWTVSSLPNAVENLSVIAAKVINPPGRLLNKAQREARALEVLAMAVALAFVENGWMAHFRPAESYLERNGERASVRNAPAQLKSGAMTAAAWAEFCSKAGVGECRLAQRHEPVAVV